MVTMKLQFENYCIRNFNFDDINSLVKYANNKLIVKYLRDGFPHPYTEQDAEKWISFVTNNPNNYSYAIANEIELIGGIGAILNSDVNRFTAEIGYWIGEPFWNKGIVTKALKTFCNYLFTEDQFNHLTASVFQGNEASMRVVKKAGFKLEGTLRKNVFKENIFLDQYIYGLLKEEFIL